MAYTGHRYIVIFTKFTTQFFIVKNLSYFFKTCTISIFTVKSELVFLKLYFKLGFLNFF